MNDGGFSAVEGNVLKIEIRDGFELQGVIPADRCNGKPGCGNALLGNKIYGVSCPALEEKFAGKRELRYGIEDTIGLLRLGCLIIPYGNFTAGNG